MNYISKFYAEKTSPIVLKEWSSLADEERLSVVNSIANNIEHVKFTRATNNGYVYLVIEKNMDPGDRGKLMLQLECLLKKEIDNGITIWHEPIGDKNSLRKLRGIEVKVL